MEKTYNPQDIEQRLYQRWEQTGDFKASGHGAPYCIVIPPPNVTGTLHMGHGFQQTLMDALIRYHRMQGDDTLWQVGCDHAGIATQMVVERQLQQQGTNRFDLGREPFVEKVKEWKEESGTTIMRQIRRLGCSVDWDRERFTMDEPFSDAVIHAFIQLHDEGFIYRGQRLVNWDPVLLTAISDLEVLNEEEEGRLFYIKYPIVNTDAHLVVATTRPETLFGDTAVAVNPEDPRYQQYIGHYIQLPLTDRTIPIIADDYVDPAFGTGCVKITPAHDFNDYAVGQRHDLPLINIFTPDAKLNEKVPAAYQGMDRDVARKAVSAALEQQQQLEKITPHTMTVPRGDRSGAVIEPYLTYQWFVKTKPLAEPAIAAVEQGDIKFIPETWSKTYFQWLHNIEDWCISRQLWWGHRIPAWYDTQGNIYVAKTEADARAKYNLDANVALTQDNDVLDTWFSSALWPFATLGWPQDNSDLERFYPTQVLVTGFDIIFFWVARMVMLGLKFIGKVPFHQVYITGLIRDHEGQKMSKSKGNVLDPLDLIDGIDLESLVTKRTQSLMQPAMAKKVETATRSQFPQGIDSYGTDALRFTFCALASNGRNIRFDVGRLSGYRNFCNKLWNATRYVLMNTEDQPLSVDPAQMTFSLADIWIRSRLHRTIIEARRQFDEFRFDLLAQCLYEFAWHEFCDWYLELSKPVLTGQASLAQQQGTRYTLLCTLETLLRLLHPIMPFITEEMWQRVAPLLNITAESVSHQAYPIADATLIDPVAEADIEWLKQVILGVRTIRGEMNISPGKALDALFRKGNAEDQERLQRHQMWVMTLAKLQSVAWLSEGEIPLSASALAGEMEILIPMAGFIDKQAELERLQKDLAKLEKEHQKVQGRLDNPSFVERAPADVVAKEQAQVQEMVLAMENIREQIERIQEL
jgi:valyl-tRNA synthetase